MRFWSRIRIPGFWSIRICGRLLAAAFSESKPSPICSVISDTLYAEDPTREDPRNGESVVKLVNINRAEPDPPLLQPPSGYAIVDDNGSVTITFKRQ